MNKSDLMILVTGLTVVLIISIVVNQPAFSLPGIVQKNAESEGINPVEESLFLQVFEREDSPFSHPFFTIQLVEKPFGYPRFHMPGSDTFQGGKFRIVDTESNTISPLFGSAPYTTAQIEAITTIEWIPVGVLEQRRGGISTTFSIPDTPYWRIRTEVTADRFPGQAQFRYVLCDAETGSILDGGEVIGRGSMRSILTSSEKEMYFIISATSIDTYRIFLEVPREHL